MLPSRVSGFLEKLLSISWNFSTLLIELRKNWIKMITVFGGWFNKQPTTWKAWWSIGVDIADELWSRIQTSWKWMVPTNEYLGKSWMEIFLRSILNWCVLLIQCQSNKNCDQYLLGLEWYADVQRVGLSSPTQSAKYVEWLVGESLPPIRHFETNIYGRPLM